jgi:hypothetical protein
MPHKRRSSSGGDTTSATLVLRALPRRNGTAEFPDRPAAPPDCRPPVGRPRNPRRRRTDRPASIRRRRRRHGPGHGAPLNRAVPPGQPWLRNHSGARPALAPSALSCDGPKAACRSPTRTASSRGRRRRSSLPQCCARQRTWGPPSLRKTRSHPTGKLPSPHSVLSYRAGRGECRPPGWRRPRKRRARCSGLCKHRGRPWLL